MAIWNAGLTSCLTVEKYQLPIDRLEDLLHYDNYKLLVLGKSADEAYFAEVTGFILEHCTCGNVPFEFR